MGSRTGGVAAAAIVALSAPSTAVAYTYGSPISDDCHERIARASLRAVREDPALELAAAPLPSSGDDEVLMSDLPFDMPSDLRDIGAVTLILGVRDNDLKGRSGIDSAELAIVHGDANGQKEHCLRRLRHDEPDGSQEALTECRDYIREMALHAASAGVDDAGLPDPEERTFLRVHLPFSQGVTVRVPIFYLYMGQSLHTLEDSFTHTFRTEDGLRVTTLLNWIDFVHGDLIERRDGPPHMRDLDKCTDIDDFRNRRLDLAKDASTALLRSAIDPALAIEEKEVAIDAVLDQYLGFEAGCTYDNRWCDAYENGYRDPTGCSCRAAPDGPGCSVGLAVLSLAALAVRRRSR